MASGEVPREGPGESNQPSALRLAKRPEIIGPVSALLGLCIGVVVGRESIPAEPAASRKSKAVESVRAPAPAEEAEEAPSPEYRRQLGHRLPKSSRGFEPIALPGRRVARISDKEAKLPFELAAVDEDYALTVIVHAAPGSGAKLEAQLDGRPLEASTLGEGWNVYYRPLPPELLAQPKHELGLSVDRGATTASIGVESVAVAPLASETRFNFGPKAVGLLLEGFSKPGGESAWSEGPRSLLVLPLTPEPTDYRLTVRAGALSRLAPLTVTAKVNGTDLGTAVFAKKVTENSWEVPAKAMKSGANEVEFSYPHTARPTEYNSNSKDNRLLALRFYSVALLPEQ